MEVLLSRKYASLIDDVAEFERAIARPLPGCFWMHPTRANEAELLQWFSEHKIECSPLHWYPGAWRVSHDVKLGNTVPFAAGWYCVQEEIALTAVKALDAQPGEKILDMCASPGGKTAQISFAVGNSGMVVANEKQWQRLTALATKVDAMALANVVVTHANAMALTLEPASFDKVLADVPCSGEGTVRKLVGGVRPMEGRFERVLPQTQASILRRALRLVKPGGVVVYSTCTLNPLENEAVLSQALGDLGVVEKFEFNGLKSSSGILSWNGQKYRDDVVNAHRFYPHQNDTGGFFVARIRRTQVPFKREKNPRENKQCEYFLLDDEQREDVLRWLQWRYEVSREHFSQYHFMQRANVIRLVSRSVEIPNERVDIVGVGAFEKTSKGFVLTAPGAQIVATLAKRAVVELVTASELACFMRGAKTSFLSDARWKGIVAVRYRGFGLGKGILLNGELESHLPKAYRHETNVIETVCKAP